MIVISVRIRSSSGEELERLLSEVCLEALRLDGCTQYSWYRSPVVSDQYFVFGEFESESSFHAYLKSSVVEKIGSELIPLLAGPPAFRHYQATILADH